MHDPRTLLQGDPRPWPAQIATGWDLKVFHRR
jgi:hypothetical protein